MNFFSVLKKILTKITFKTPKSSLWGYVAFAVVGILIVSCDLNIQTFIPEKISILDGFDNLSLTFPQDYALTAKIASFVILLEIISLCFYLGGVIGFGLLCLLGAFSIFELFVAHLTGFYGDSVFIAIAASGLFSNYLYVLFLTFLVILALCAFFRKTLPKIRPFTSIIFGTCILLTLTLQINQFQRNSLPLLAKNSKWGSIGTTLILYWPYWSYRSVSSKTFEQWDRVDGLSLQTPYLLSQAALYIRRAFPGSIGDALGLALIQFDPGPQPVQNKSKTFPRELQPVPSTPKAPLVVIVIGEASTPDRWGLLRYEWDTTPFLATREKNGEICHLNMAHAVSHQTKFAILPDLSMWSPTHRDAISKNKNIFDLAKANHFETYYLNLQPTYGIYVGDAGLPMMDADHYAGSVMPHSPPLLPGFSSEKIKGKSDIQALIPLFKQVLNDQSHAQKFIVLHPWGSHHPYSLRYDTQDKHAHDRADDYDLSIYHTDRFLDQILTELKNTHIPSILFYASDHGEEVWKGHGLLYIDHRDFPIPVLAAGLNGVSTAELCKNLETYRGEDGWYNSVMNRYFIANLLGYKSNAVSVQNDRKTDQILSLENDYSAPLPWKPPANYTAKTK